MVSVTVLGDRFPMLSDRCLSVLSVTFVYCGQTVAHIKMKLHKHVGCGPGHIVLDGAQIPLPKGAQPPPQFSPHVCCGQMARWFNMSLSSKVGIDSGDIVFDGDPTPVPKKTLQSLTPQISAHV